MVRSIIPGRGITAGCVAPPSNIPDILGRRALPDGRLAGLGATADLHHGLLAGRNRERATSGMSDVAYFANGSGRIWNRTTLLVVPFPVSMWNGARVLTVAHSPFPFHPAFGSSIRPSIHFV